MRAKAYSHIAQTQVESGIYTHLYLAQTKDIFAFGLNIGTMDNFVISFKNICR